MRLTKRQLERSIRASLHRKLEEPQRKALEEQFALDHMSDTDEDLYEYIKGLKRRLGRRMTPESTVGYRYFVKRLGSWSRFITQINKELAEEKTAL